MSSTRARLLQAQSHTTLQRDSLPDLETGRLIWNITDDTFEVYNGVRWLVYDPRDSLIDANNLYGEIDGGTY